MCGRLLIQFLIHRGPLFLPLFLGAIAGQPVLAANLTPKMPREAQICDRALKEKQPTKPTTPIPSINTKALLSAISNQYYEMLQFEKEFAQAQKRLDRINEFPKLNYLWDFKSFTWQRDRLRASHRRILSYTAKVLETYGFQVKVVENPVVSPGSIAGYLKQLIALYDAKFEAQILEKFALKLAKEFTEELADPAKRDNAKKKYDSLYVAYPYLRDLAEVTTNVQKTTSAWDTFVSANLHNPTFHKAMEIFAPKKGAKDNIITLRNVIESYEEPYIEIVEFPDSLNSETGNPSRLASTVRKKHDTFFFTNVSTHYVSSMGAHIKSLFEKSRIFLNLKMLLDFPTKPDFIRRTAIHESLHQYLSYLRSLGQSTDLDLKIMAVSGEGIAKGYQRSLAVEEALTWSKDAISLASHLERNPSDMGELRLEFDDHVRHTQEIVKVSLENIRAARAS
ncbi:MAG TPA: hypothetical protein PLU50_01420, partial [Pseudobdellovibrionaceae bacterium]|nr:hypothetical protein [Pseudobdellovibrionaceae bacterium]